MRILTQSRQKRAQNVLTQEQAEKTQNQRQVIDVSQRLSNKGEGKEFCLRFPTHTQDYKINKQSQGSIKQR